MVEFETIKTDSNQIVILVKMTYKIYLYTITKYLKIDKILDGYLKKHSKSWIL